MNLLHPKALRVSNLMEGFLEEMRERNNQVVKDAVMRKRIEMFGTTSVRQSDDSGPARGVVIGTLWGIAFWGGLFLVRWFIRLCS